MTTETASIQIPVVDHDPLPEASWLWRRVFTFCVTTAVLWMVWGAITRLGSTAVLAPAIGIPALLSLCRYLLLLATLLITYYMVAPSAEQIVKMFQVAAMLKGGVQFAGRTVTQTPGTTTDTAATAGQAPAPPVPPAAPVAPPAPAADAVGDVSAADADAVRPPTLFDGDKP